MQYIKGLKIRLAQVECMIHDWQQRRDSDQCGSFRVDDYLESLENERRQIVDRLRILQPGRPGR